MNDNTLTRRLAQWFASSASHLWKTLLRARYLLPGQTPPEPGPQWQQLELPFTRTPVKRWNR